MTTVRPSRIEPCHPHPREDSHAGATRRAALLAAMAVVTSTAPGLARAQPEYPGRAVRVVVPFAPGGTVDVVARILSVAWTELLSQPFVIDNRSGAGGVAGADNVAKSPADGYSLLAFHVGLTYGAGLFKKLPYDARRDFQPVGLIGVAPSILVVNPGSPIKSVSELLALAKKQPDALNYASAGIGASSHLAVALLQVVTGARFTHVPYRGGAPAVMAVMAGETQLMIETSASVLAHIKSGKLRALATTGEARLADLPDVPTMKEAGVDDYLYTTWFGLWAPAGTPKAIVDKLNQVTNAALDKPATKQGLARAGVEVRRSTVADFEKLVGADANKWLRVIRSAGIEPE